MNAILSDFVRTLEDHGNTILDGQTAFLESLGEQFKGHSAGVQWTKSGDPSGPRYQIFNGDKGADDNKCC